MEVKIGVTIAEAEFLRSQGVITPREYDDFLRAKANIIRDTIKEDQILHRDPNKVENFDDCRLPDPADFDPNQETSIKMM